MKNPYKVLLPFALFLLCTFSARAQQKSNIPLSLYEFASHYAPGQLIGVLVEGSPVAVAEAAKKHGGFLRYAQGTICSVNIPAGALIAFSKEPGVVRIGNAVNNRPLNDTIKAHCRVNEVHAGMAPLPQSYKGENMIIGIIDSGIDFTHPDFLDSLGNTRILNIWDQRDTSGTGPSPWNYGTLWDSAQINAGTCTHNDLAYYGHGTHVSGIAGGDGSSVSAVDYSGMAPRAEFVVVALDFNGAYSPVAVADAAAYIYQRAQALGRPCAINASVGDYMGSHDGQDLQALMIDSLLDTPGRAFITAAGNAGNLPIHLSYPLSSDTNITWYTTSGFSIYLQVWADTATFNGQLAIGCTKDGVFSDRGRTPFIIPQQNLNLLVSDTLRNSAGQQLAIVNRFVFTQGNAYGIEYQIVPDSAAGYNYSLMTTGSGVFHSWSFDMYGMPLPTAVQYPDIIYYKEPDTTYTICSSFQCSNRTITVANFVNRDTWMNYNNAWTVDTTVTAGAIMWNSSVGPTRDGRIKPDISAPGANDISCGVVSSMPGIIAGAPWAVGVGGYHVAGGGTSAASPVVAGCAALWMQQFPSATWLDVRNAVVYCARTDTFTGTALPDPTWGHGKIDAFSMMTSCALTTDHPGTEQTNALQLFPNPVSSQQPVQLQFSAQQSGAQLEIFSVNGQLVYSQVIAQGQSSAVVPANVLVSGLYLVRITDGTSWATQKLIVE